MPRFNLKPGSYKKASRKQGGRVRSRPASQAVQLTQALTRTPALEIGSHRPKVHTTLKYSIQGGIITTNFNATPGRVYWFLNSIYSPDGAGGGHQPLYRDELAAQYLYYKVRACTVTVIACIDPTTNTSTANSQVLLVGGTALPAATNVVFNSLCEDRTRMTAGPRIVLLGNSNVVMLKKRYVISQLLGMVEADYAMGNWNTQVMGSNPSTLAYGTFMVSGLDASGYNAVGYRVTLEYEVELSGPIVPAQS